MTEKPNSASKVKERTLTKLKKYLEEKEFVCDERQYPKVTVIVPTFDCAQIILLTIESILDQQYRDFELLIIDGGSQDRTIEIVKSIKDDRIKFFSIAGNKRYEMINKGISQAAGQYISILFPGDYYISRHTLSHVIGLAVKRNLPDLVYAGSLLRDGKREAKILYRPLELRFLKRGQQPTSIQACWFKNQVFKDIGKFNTELKMRGGYELLCRYVLASKFETASTSRVLSDYDLRSVTWKMVVTHFVETAKIIKSYFGFFAMLQWFTIQKDSSRFFNLWLSSLKVAFTGR